MDQAVDFSAHGNPVAAYRRAVGGGVDKEVRAWALLAVLSLAIAGLFALFIAFSRIPGLSTAIPWPSDFFQKGLVIHVVFSFVVWFLAVFAVLAALAGVRLAAGGTLRLSWAGRAGVAVTALSFPLLFLPAIFGDTTAVLSNYVPVIEHPLYDTGVVLLFAGVLLPVVRLFANLPGRRQGLRDPLIFGSVIGGGVYLIALVSLVIAVFQAAGSPENFYENVYWGGGHVLQFLNTLLMICGWYLLARLSFEDEIFDPHIFRLATALLLIFVLPAPLLYAKYGALSAKLDLIFTNLQYGLGPPVLLMLGAGLVGLKKRTDGFGKLPWRDAAFLCLALSPLVFGIGGLFGFVVDGTDTRTPAHYHGVIAGVNLVFMGVFICFLLPVIGRALAIGRSIRALIHLFGFGQLFACIGLFLAGGYGAPRKAPDEAVDLIDAAAVGLYMNGIGALVAVIGGAMFIWIVLVALLRESQDAQ